MVMFYHGSSNAYFQGYVDGHGASDDPSYMFMSLSSNVAQRYGSVFGARFEDGWLKSLPQISVIEWFNNKVPDHGSFIIAGDEGYDFPVDTLVFCGEVACQWEVDLSLVDDGLALRHEPQSESDRQFSEYLAEHYLPHFDNDADLALQCWREERRLLV